MESNQEVKKDEEAVSGCGGGAELSESATASVKQHHVELSECPMVSVMVYEDAAEVCRSVKVEHAQTGIGEVVLNKVSTKLLPDSIRVDGRGNATIAEVIFRTKSVEQVKADESNRVKSLKKRLDDLNREKEVMALKKERLEKQKRFLDGFTNKVQEVEGSKFGKPVENGSERSSASPLSPSGQLLESLSTYLDWYDTRAEQCDNALFQVKVEMARLNEEIAATDKNLKVMKIPSSSQAREIIVVLDVEKEGPLRLVITYLVNGACWTPMYDLRFFSKENILKVMYYANIRQSTGEDWADTKISLSTAQPNVSGSPPQLSTSSLTIRQPFYRSGIGSMSFAKGARRKGTKLFGKAQDDLLLKSSLGGMDLECNINDEVEVLADFGQKDMMVSENIISTSYEILRRSTIPSDSTDHKVTVAIVDLAPSLEYQAIPRLVQRAFIKATLKNTSGYAFRAGPASVYIDGSFVSKSELNNVSPSEEFTCSLGVDPAVRIDYKPVQKFQQVTGLISKMVIYTYHHVTQINNTRNQSIKLTAEQQLPRSADSKIKVILLEPAIKGVKDQEKHCEVKFGLVVLNKSSILEWKLDIPAGTKHEVHLKYNVEYPKGEIVDGLPS